MSRRAHARLAVAAGVAAVLVAVLAPATPSAAPVSWTAALAAETDTVVFARADGSLWRAPFHLGSHEALWTAGGRQSVVRFRVSPDGRSVAWLTRAGDLDTTSLWTAGAAPPARPRVRYPSLVSRRLGRMHFEPELPTARDPGIRGGRLVSPGPQHLRHSSNTLAWMPDASGIVFGYDDGLAFLPADSGAAREVSTAWIVELAGLDPATVFLADLVAVVDERRTDGWHLLYPAAGHWRVFEAAGLDRSSLWTASSTTVWWADGDRIRAIQAHDPTARVVAEGPGTVTWLRYDPAVGVLHWVQGDALHALAETDARPGVVRRFAAPVTRALDLARATGTAFVAGDSLHVWSPAAGFTGTVALGGFAPDRVFEHEGTWVLAGKPRGGKLELARFRAGEPLARAGAGGSGGINVAWSSPSGARVIVAQAGRRPPETLRIYDVATGTWTEVTNPGLLGWEPMRPW